jgi:hypothetical protein
MTDREPKPVAWLSKCYNDDNEFLGYTLWDRDVGESCFPVYTAPQSREWVGLTDDDVREAFNTAYDGEDYGLIGDFSWFAEIIEAKLKEKNT